MGLFNRLLIGDIFDEKKASDYYAYLMASILIALILAPFFGGIFASMERWDYSFIFLGFVSGLSALTIWLFIPETLDKKRAFSLKAIWSQNKAILFQPTFYNFTIVHSVLLGAVISFFATASFYYIRKIGISPGTFSIHQVSIAFVNLGSSLLAPWFFKYFGVPKTIRISLVLITLGTIVFTWFSIYDSTTPILLSCAATIFVFGACLCTIATISMIMNSFPDERATTASLIVLFRGILLVICISLGSYLYKGKAIQIAYAFITFTLISLFFYYRQTRRHSPT